MRDYFLWAVFLIGIFLILWGVASPWAQDKDLALGLILTVIGLIGSVLKGK